MLNVIHAAIILYSIKKKLLNSRYLRAFFSVPFGMCGFATFAITSVVIIIFVVVPSYKAVVVVVAAFLLFCKAYL